MELADISVHIPQWLLEARVILCFDVVFFHWAALRKYAYAYVWMDGWMHGCMESWMHGCMDGWMHGRMYVCMHVRNVAPVFYMQVSSVINQFCWHHFAGLESFSNGIFHPRLVSGHPS